MRRPEMATVFEQLLLESQSNRNETRTSYACKNLSFGMVTFV
jgi:hypothetical protein